jgi:hypothetical protein
VETPIEGNQCLYTIPREKKAVSTSVWIYNPQTSKVVITRNKETPNISTKLQWSMNTVNLLQNS